jgi:hypothetical protein
MIEPLLGLSPKGFSEEMRLKAALLREKVQTGNATLGEIQEFLLAGKTDLTKSKAKRNLPFKAEDVDFF